MNKIVLAKISYLDVRKIRPGWTKRQCERYLNKYKVQIERNMLEAGACVLKNYIDCI